MNHYEILGDMAVIYCEQLDGALVEAIVDTEDLPHIMSLDKKWFVSKTNGRLVVMAHTTGGKKTIYLSRWILRIKDTHVNVDYVNHNSLDNRRLNLIPLSKSGSALLRQGPNKNNTTGYLGVSWIERTGKYVAQLYHRGTNYYLGRYVDAEEAAYVVAVKREELVEKERLSPPLPKSPKFCTADGCERRVMAKGLCNMHYSRKRQGYKGVYEDAREKTCAVDGCERKRHGRGYCTMHFARLKTKGEVGTAEKQRPGPMPADKTCIIPGCVKPKKGRGMCWMHYQRDRRAVIIADDRRGAGYGKTDQKDANR